MNQLWSANEDAFGLFQMCRTLQRQQWFVF